MFLITKMLGIQQVMLIILSLMQIICVVLSARHNSHVLCHSCSVQLLHSIVSKFTILILTIIKTGWCLFVRGSIIQKLLNLFFPPSDEIFPLLLKPLGQCCNPSFCNLNKTSPQPKFDNLYSFQTKFDLVRLLPL